MVEGFGKPNVDRRAERAFELFQAHPKISWDDFRQAALDLKVLHAEPYLQTMIEASEGQTDPDLREVKVLRLRRV